MLNRMPVYIQKPIVKVRFGRGEYRHAHLVDYDERTGKVTLVLTHDDRLPGEPAEREVTMRQIQKMDQARILEYVRAKHAVSA